MKGVTDAGRELEFDAPQEGTWQWMPNANGSDAFACSDEAASLLGYSSGATSHLFNKPQEWIHSEGLSEFESLIEKVLLAGGGSFLSIRIHHKSSKDAYDSLTIRGVVSRNENEEVTEIAGWVSPTIGLSRVLNNLRDEKHRLLTVLENVPLNIYLKDRRSRFVLVNSATAKKMGKKSPKDIIGMTDHDFFNVKHADKSLQDELQIIESGKPMLEMLEQEVWENKEDTFVITSKVPWLDRQGIVRGVLGVTSDVTSLVRTQQQLMDMTYQLTSRNKVMREEIELAHQIQLSMIEEGQLKQFPENADESTKRRVNFAFRYQPASGMAGDLYQVIPLDANRVGIFMCDVMGHGVRSALIVSMLRGLMEKERGDASSPELFLKGLNSGLVSILQRAGITMFATAFYGVIDLDKKSLCYANAGHPSPITVTSDQKLKRLSDYVKVTGPALGLVEGFEYEAGEVSFDLVKMLILFTDGIYEAENSQGEEFGVEGLTSCVTMSSTIEANLDNMVHSAQEFSATGKFDDDVCLMGIRWRELED